MILMRRGLVVAVALVASSCGGGRLIAVGLDRSGRAVAATFNESIYERRMTEALIKVHDSVLEATEDSPTRQDGDWDLQVIAVGLNVRADIGFGPFRLGVAPGVRAFFTSNDNPPPLP